MPRRLSPVSDTLRSEGVVVDGPAILEFGPADDRTVMPIYGARVVDVLDDKVLIAYVTGRGGAGKELRLDQDGVTQNTVTGRVRFSSNGTVYVIRAYEDNDGRLLSRYRIDVPAESLVASAEREAGMAYATNTPSDDEILYAGLDADGNVTELVYSSAEGSYIRSSGGWFKLPDDDNETLESLDQVVDVEGVFVETFDKAEESGKTLTQSDVERYSVEETT